MKIAVCIEQVIDVTFPFDLDPGTCTLNGDDIFYIVNPADLCAANIALKIRKEKGGEVIFISFGPSRVEEALRACLALGGDRAIHVWDDHFVPESCATAYVLAGVMKVLSPDLILCGSQSLDERGSEVAAGIAEYLGLPQVTGVMAVDMAADKGKVRVERKIERGRRVALECPLPAVLAVEPGIEQPGYASLPRMLEATRAEITRMDWDALGMDMGRLREISSRRRLIRRSLPRLRPKKVFTFDSNLSADERLDLMMSGGMQQAKSDILEGNPKDLAAKLAEILQKQAPGKP